VQILDLRIVSELLEWPSQLPHYLRRRLSLNESEVVEAHDEVDWLAQYLRGGLYFDEVVEARQLSRVSVVGADEVDAYYAFQSGERQKPVKKPRAPMPDRFRQMVTELEGRGWGYTAVSAILLYCGWKTKKLIDKSILTLRSRSQRDGKVHNASVEWDDRWGALGSR
jgi:hypothetical protein